VLATKVLICKPADPEAKGIVERLHDYVERSFLPGRRFSSPADFNSQLSGWLQLANRRRKRSLGLCSGGPDRRGPGSDVGLAAGAARHRMGDVAAAAA
jgi:hypothetical protein